MQQVLPRYRKRGQYRLLLLLSSPALLLQFKQAHQVCNLGLAVWQWGQKHVSKL